MVEPSPSTIGAKRVVIQFCFSCGPHRMADSTANSLKTKLEELDIFIRELGKQFREQHGISEPVPWRPPAQPSSPSHNPSSVPIIQDSPAAQPWYPRPQGRNPRKQKWNHRLGKWELDGRVRNALDHAAEAHARAEGG